MSYIHKQKDRKSIVFTSTEQNLYLGSNMEQTNKHIFDIPIYILTVRQAVSDNVTKIFQLFYITVITNF